MANDIVIWRIKAILPKHPISLLVFVLAVEGVTIKQEVVTQCNGIVVKYWNN
jgi:DNA-directed RNA polymerase subunit F